MVKEIRWRSGPLWGEPGGGPRTMYGRDQANPKAGFTVTRKKDQSKSRGGCGGWLIGPMGCKRRGGAGPRGVSNRLWWARRGCRSSGPGIKQGGEHAGSPRGLRRRVGDGLTGSSEWETSQELWIGPTRQRESLGVANAPSDLRPWLDCQVCSGEETL